MQRKNRFAEPWMCFIDLASSILDLTTARGAPFEEIVALDPNLEEFHLRTGDCLFFKDGMAK